MEVLAEGLRFPEGPIALADGSVVLVEIESGHLTRVSADGAVERVAHCGGGPNGAALGPDGRIYVCNNGGFEWHEVPVPGVDQPMLFPGDQPAGYIGGRIQTVDLATGAVEDLYTECDGVPLLGPNDLVFDAHGGFYFTDLGKGHPAAIDRGAIYYAIADGSKITKAAGPMITPNGCGLSPDGSRLYAAETLPGRVWWWQVVAPGVLEGGLTLAGSGGGNFLYATGEYHLYDSLAVEAGGNVVVATLIAGALTVISPEGALVDLVDLPDGDPMTTNVCFGGDDHRTAFVTKSAFGRLYRLDWPRAGLRLNHSG